MSVNRYRPHVFVIPEDDADREIADGFVLHPRVTSHRQIQVVAPAGGWNRVLDTFKAEYLPILRQNQNAHVIMLIDFDGDPDARRVAFEEETPEPLRPRVFVLGPRHDPETLKRALGKSFEAIGTSLADDCEADTEGTWAHEQLRHNEADRVRLFDTVKPFLFL